MNPAYSFSPRLSDRHVPETIGKYRVLGVVGRGAMGTVYEAHDPVIDRKVAIKVCRKPEDEADARLIRSRFFNEAKAVGALDHPNILRVYEAHEEDGQFCLVMEFVHGGLTLKPFCSPDNRLPMETAVRYVAQCANALQYAHSRGITHRDIKPSNIMLTPGQEAKIVDFGIALRRTADNMPLLTSIGSPRYMSPEQARDEALTPQTDIYSLGVTLYELLAGRPPFDAQGLMQLVLLVTSQDPPSLKQVRPDVPQALADMVGRAMARSLDKRYLSAREFADALEEIEAALETTPFALDMDQSFRAVRTLAFFGDFSDDELEEILAVATWERFPSGAAVVEQGVEEDCFYVLVTGDIQVLVDNQHVATLGPGECLGELSYMTGQERSATATVTGEALALKIEGRPGEWASIPVQTRLTKAFQRTMAGRLIAANHRLAHGPPIS